MKRANPQFNPIGLRLRQARKEKYGSSTPGSVKGVRCQADANARFMAKRSRSYRTKQYVSWCISKDKQNYGGKSPRRWK